MRQEIYVSLAIALTVLYLKLYFPAAVNVEYELSVGCHAVIDWPEQKDATLIGDSCPCAVIVWKGGIISRFNIFIEQSGKKPWI